MPSEDRRSVYQRELSQKHINSVSHSEFISSRRACRDITLNTQYMVLFNNPIDRQQVENLARRIYPSTSTIFMKRFEQATSNPYGYLVIDLKSDTPEKDRLHRKIDVDEESIDANVNEEEEEEEEEED